MATSSLILESYLQTFDMDKMDELRRNKMVDNLIAYNKKLRGVDFLTPLGYFLSMLENTDEVMFLFMSQEKKDVLLRDLQVTYLLLLAQKRHEQTHQKTENLKSYDASIAKCQQLIDALNYQKVCEEQHIVPSPEHGYATDGYPIKYAFIELGQWFGEKIEEIANRQTKTIKEAMGWFNEKRLYWVWGGGLLKTVLDLLPPDFFNVTDAAKQVKAPDPYTGAISWGLYYFRGSLNLFLLLKHTIQGPWMSKEESDTPWTERFLTQWSQRKFTLLNDFVWATGNCLCYFVLTGKGALGTWGDFLTLALLAFDIGLAVWEFEEKRTEFFKEMQNYDREIEVVKELIKKIEDDPDADETDKKRLKECYLQLQSLEKAKRQCQKDWDYQNIGLATNISYAVGLMLAFALVALPFLPITGPLLIALSVTGTVLCFAFTVINNAVKGGIEIYKAYESKKEALQDYKTKLAEFHELMLNNPDLDDNEKKLLFLEIKKTLAETEYQKQMILFQTMHLVRSLIMETFIPAIIFVNLVFLPLGIGFALIGAAIVLAVCTNLLINKLFTPEKMAIKEFDEQEYKAFCADPDHWGIKSSKGMQNFFKPAEALPPTPEVSQQDTDEQQDDHTAEQQPLLEPQSGPCNGLT
ncbi:hypothetical protein [Legionella quateirensis]|uniref:Coiled-coil protein n=1 Tax=Legionella quateirensis TaxID=45072 RepID=A0A378KXY0_9GAMM|nr:hypothetical protein [Legionella quateirensis]KTD49297.1 coiled-coil protein [Legionella quateirensis]STY19393.1 coiled-coil protein [Legionella quateirensis]